MKQRIFYDLRPESSWVKFPFLANFWVTRGLSATRDPKIGTQGGNFPHSFSGGRAS